MAQSCFGNPHANEGLVVSIESRFRDASRKGTKTPNTIIYSGDVGAVVDIAVQFRNDSSPLGI